VNRKTKQVKPGGKELNGTRTAPKKPQREKGKGCRVIGSLTRLTTTITGKTRPKEKKDVKKHRRELRLTHADQQEEKRKRQGGGRKGEKGILTDKRRKREKGKIRKGGADVEKRNAVGGGETGKDIQNSWSARRCWTGGGRTKRKRVSCRGYDEQRLNKGPVTFQLKLNQP